MVDSVDAVTFPVALPDLPGDWEYALLRDLVEDRGICYGIVQPGIFSDDGTPVLRVNNIRNGRIDAADVLKVDPSVEAKFQRSRLRGGEVLLTLVGTLGEVAIVPESMRGWNVARAVGVLTVRQDPGNRWVAICLRSVLCQHCIQSWATTTVQATFNLRDVANLPIPLPPAGLRGRIAHILGTLDDKIELNRRMNATLEAMSQAIFKSWFVDFDSVRQKAAGKQPVGMDCKTAALFPNSFTDSEIGEVPRGWAACTLDDYTQTVIGGDWGASEPSATSDSLCLCIRGADIPSLQRGGVGKLPLRYVKSSSLQKRRLAPWDLVVEISGGSPTQSTGRPVLVTEGLVERLRLPLIASNFCRIVKLKEAEQAPFIYFCLRHLYDSDVFLQYENGTTGIKNFAYTLFASRYPLLAPDRPILQAFYSAVSPLIEVHQQKARESDSLAALRDTLLPKLLSGEIRVPEAEEAVEEAVG